MNNTYPDTAEELLILFLEDIQKFKTKCQTLYEKVDKQCMHALLETDHKRNKILSDSGKKNPYELLKILEAKLKETIRVCNFAILKPQIVEKKALLFLKEGEHFQAERKEGYTSYKKRKNRETSLWLFCNMVGLQQQYMDAVDYKWVISTHEDLHKELMEILYTYLENLNDILYKKE